MSKKINYNIHTQWKAKQQKWTITNAVTWVTHSDRILSKEVSALKENSLNDSTEMKLKNGQKSYRVVRVKRVVHFGCVLKENERPVASWKYHI